MHDSAEMKNPKNDDGWNMTLISKDEVSLYSSCCNNECIHIKGPSHDNHVTLTVGTEGTST